MFYAAVSIFPLQGVCGQALATVATLNGTTVASAAGGSRNT